MNWSLIAAVELFAIVILFFVWRGPNGQRRKWAARIAAFLAGSLPVAFLAALFGH